MKIKVNVYDSEDKALVGRIKVNLNSTKKATGTLSLLTEIVRDGNYIMADYHWLAAVLNFEHPLVMIQLLKAMAGLNKKQKKQIKKAIKYYSKCRKPTLRVAFQELGYDYLYNIISSFIPEF